MRFYKYEMCLHSPPQSREDSFNKLYLREIKKTQFVHRENGKIF